MSRVFQDSLPLGVTLKHTVASRRNQQWVEQCAWCGTLVCVSNGAGRAKSEPLGPCPACGCANWVLQYVPGDGLGMIVIDKERAPAATEGRSEP